jgi:hypothetical protein
MTVIFNDSRGSTGWLSEQQQQLEAISGFAE